MYKKTWTWGDKTRLANLTGISKSYLTNILKGRDNCPSHLSYHLERYSKELGYNIPKNAWVFKDERVGNPLFPQK